MSSNVNALSAKYPWIRKFTGAIIVLLNIALLAGAFSMYATYNRAYDDELRTENLGNIANLNRSSAMNAISLFESWDIKLCDTVKYIEKHDLNREEALKLISDANSEEDRCFELISSDYTGFVAKENADGTFPTLNYSHKSYRELQKIIDNVNGDLPGIINFAPQYTDGGESATQMFSIYKHVSLNDGNGGKSVYTLFLATSTKTVIEVLNMNEDYNGQSTVLIDSKGNYIVSNVNYKSSNFFQYIYVYNDLSLDQKNEVICEVEEKGSGELYYKNADEVVSDCVFRYERMEIGGWYCVTCVPLSSFHEPAFRIGYIVYALVMLILLFVMDVFFLQWMNRRLRTSVQKEKEASAAKGNFMSRMSHEIRTPLNAVIGYNTIARSEMSNAENAEQRKQAEMKVMDCLDKSEIASRHLLTIINDVLDMSAIESGKIKVTHDMFDFKGLITSLTTVFYSQARAKGVNFEVVFDTLTEEWFVGDQMRTNQILTNLLSNAVKFTPEGGTVTLKIFQPEAVTNASHISFEVIDTGIGMSKEYLSHIWTPFEQADSSISRRFGGTGLGLSITKNLVDLMGGTISVESLPSIGTTFRVDLTYEKAEQSINATSYNFSTINALVVDDDVSTCDYIRLLFNRCGARCAAVTSGEDAVNAVSVAKVKGEYYSVCLVDWRMPQMDGIETVRRIREIVGEKLPIIVLTAYDYTELADSAAEIGVNQFISKPLFQSSLFDLLASISGSSQANRMEKSNDVDFTGTRILLAEDNMMNMEIAKTIMESVGIIVDSAWNGKQAVEMFTSSEPETYMAILMDVHMPEMNGHDATRAIRVSSHPQANTIPIIAMTADAFAENVAEALSAGMNDHIAKPIDVPSLFATLRKYRQGS